MPVFVRAPVARWAPRPPDSPSAGRTRPAPKIALAIFIYLYVFCQGVDGVSVKRSYHAIYPPFRLHPQIPSEFSPRRPLPRPARIVCANCRLPNRSTANPAALTRLFCRIRHLSLLWTTLPVFFCPQTISPHVRGDDISRRLRRLRLFNADAFTCRLYRPQMFRSRRSRRRCGRSAGCRSRGGGTQ